MKRPFELCLGVSWGLYNALACDEVITGPNRRQRQCSRNRLIEPRRQFEALLREEPLLKSLEAMQAERGVDVTDSPGDTVNHQRIIIDAKEALAPQLFRKVGNQQPAVKWVTVFERQDDALTRAIKPRVTQFLAWHQSLSPFWGWVCTALAVVIALFVSLRL